MLRQATRRTGVFNGRVNLIEADFIKYELSGKYDVIFSAATLHNLPNEEKRKLFGKIFKHLSEGGCFVNADFIKFKSAHLTKKVADFYENFLTEKLAGRELEHWFRHFKEEDLPITIGEQFAWLKEAGFSSMECRWMYQNLAIVYAIK